MPVAIGPMTLPPPPTALRAILHLGTEDDIISGFTVCTFCVRLHACVFARVRDHRHAAKKKSPSPIADACSVTVMCSPARAMAF